MGVVQETVVLLKAWFNELCLNKGSWKTPSTQFLRVVTGESCRSSRPLTGEVASGEGLREDGWNRSMHDEYSAWFNDVAVCAKDQIRGFPSIIW